MTSPVSAVEAIEKAMRDHIKVDATGLSPAVASAYVFGFDEAAKAIAEIIARQAEALQRENAELSKAVLEVLNAVRDYLPPDGISAQGCLSRVIGAVDNDGINPLIKKLERADVDV